MSSVATKSVEDVHMKTEPSPEPLVDEHYLQRSKWKSICLVLTCTMGMIVNTAISTSVSIALPTMQRDLDIQEVQLKWIISGYPLSSGCLLLLFGRLADLYGRKKVFLLGTIWLAAFGLGCGFVNDDVTLDILRGVQGVGAAATIPASLGILAHAFPPSRARSAAFATFAAGAPLGGAFGSVLGGILTQYSAKTWRSNFYLLTGLTVLCLLGALFSFDPDLPSTETDQRVDWIGAFLVTAGLVLVVFVVGDGETAPQQWSTPYIIALLVVGVVLCVAFIFWQQYLEKIQDDPNAPYSKWTPPPLMRPSLWGRANGRMAVMMWIAFLNWCCFIGWTYWSQLYYQNYLGLTPIQTVVRLLPMSVTGVLCNLFVALLVGYIPVVYLMAFGTALTGSASLLFAVINTSSSYWAFGFPAAVVSVIGADFVFAAGTIFVAKVSMPHEQSVAGAVFQTMTQLGTSVGVTVSTVVFNRVQGNRLGEGFRESQLEAYRAAHWTDFGFGMIATMLSVMFLRHVGVVGHVKKKTNNI